MHMLESNWILLFSPTVAAKKSESNIILVRVPLPG